MKKYTIWIVWATWAVGKEMIDCLWELKIPIEKLRLWASSRSTGKIIKTPFGNKKIEEVNDEFFNSLDFVLFSAWWSNSQKFIPIAIKKGCRVIDNSSAFRYDEKVPLIVPQVNPQEIGNALIIANPIVLRLLLQ